MYFLFFFCILITFVYQCMPGIVPITCEELFKGIEAKKGTEAEYQVVLNMLEIYNEQV